MTFCYKFVYIYLHTETSKISNRRNALYTTSNEGLLNNYATEPAVYYAEYPSPEQQRQYALQGAIATLFVTALTLVAFAAN